MKSYWVQGAVGAAILAATEESLRNYAQYHWADQAPKSSSSKSSSSSSSSSVDTLRGTKSKSKTTSTTSSSASATPTQYMINSKKGTSATTFKNYISTLPDGGSGTLSNYPFLDWQYYITNLTSEQAKEVASQSFVDWVYQNSVDDNTEFGVITSGPSSRVQKRALGDLDRRDDAPDHLQLLSEGKWHHNEPSSQFDQYLYDPTNGKGQTIYIIDSGYYEDAQDFQNTDEREIRGYTVPNQITLSQITELGDRAPENLRDYRQSFHGTKVACVAAGKVRGVAPLANLVIVKFRNGAKNKFNPNAPYIMQGVTYWAINDAWMFVLNDIAAQRRNGNTGKFIINMSYGWKESISDWDRRSVLVETLIQRAWIADAVVVVPTGNDGDDDQPRGLQHETPARMGTTANALITVGGVDASGFLWAKTTPDLGQGQGGSISLYAQAYQLTLASGDPNAGADGTVSNQEGTSFAAPAVAGLAAYFFSLPSLSGEWHAGSIAQNMKDYLVAQAWQRQDGAIDSAVPPRTPYVKPAPGSLRVAWNRAPDGLCASDNPQRLKRSDLHSVSPHLAKRQSSGLGEPVVVGGSIIASNAAGICPAPSTSSSSRSPSSTSLRPSPSSTSSKPSPPSPSPKSPLPSSAHKPSPLLSTPSWSPMPSSSSTTSINDTPATLVPVSSPIPSSSFTQYVVSDYSWKSTLTSLLTRWTGRRRIL